MCATEGQAFDDLFVIIFISSQEKFSHQPHTSHRKSTEGRAPQRDINYSTNRCMLIGGNQWQPQTKAKSFGHQSAIKHQTEKTKVRARNAVIL